MVVAAVLEVVLGDQLVVAREAVGGQHGQDPGGHETVERAASGPVPFLGEVRGAHFPGQSHPAGQGPSARQSRMPTRTAWLRVG